MGTDKLPNRVTRTAVKRYKVVAEFYGPENELFPVGKVFEPDWPEAQIEAVVKWGKVVLLSEDEDTARREVEHGENRR